METTGKSYWVVDRGATAQLDPAGDVAGTPRPDDRRARTGTTTSPGTSTRPRTARKRFPLLPTDVIFNRYPDPEDPYSGCGPIHQRADRHRSGPLCGRVEPELLPQQRRAWRRDPARPLPRGRRVRRAGRPVAGNPPRRSPGAPHRGARGRRDLGAECPQLEGHGLRESPVGDAGHHPGSPRHAQGYDRGHATM